MDTSPVPNQTEGSSPAPAARKPSGARRLTDQERWQRRLDALTKGIDWSYVIIGQVARLHQAEQAAQLSERARRERRDYLQQDRQPFAWLRAEAYFLLGAARQLVRALAAYGDTKNVPAFVHGTAVLTAVRDAAEHWDGRAPGRLSSHTDAPWDDYRFGAGGSRLAGVLPVDDLLAWAHEVQAYLLQAEREWR